MAYGIIFSSKPRERSLRFRLHKNPMLEVVILIPLALQVIKIYNSVKKKKKLGQCHLHGAWVIII